MRTLPLLAALSLLAVAPLVASLPEAATFVTTPLAAVAVPTALAFGPGDGDGPDLYATTLAGNVERVSLQWTAAGPVATGTSLVATGFSQPLGIVFDGNVAYVADSHPGEAPGRTDGRMWRLEDGTRTVVVDGLPNGRHQANHLRFGPDGRLYIANGNPNDAGKNGGAADVLPYSGAILSVDVDEVSASPAILRYRDGSGALIPAASVAGHPVNAGFAAKVQVFGAGFRNVFGIAFSPSGVGYTAMNGADEPSSQDALFRIEPGADYAFPYCFNEGEPGAVGDDITVATNPLYPGYDCGDVPRATALLGWHICATGLDFPTEGPFGFRGAYASSVYIAECGPFFPEPQNKGFSTHDTGHKIARVEIDPATGEALAVTDFLTGLALPTDVLFGPDGAMYVADAGGVLRVAGLPGP